LVCTGLACEPLATAAPQPSTDPATTRANTVRTTFESVDSTVAAEWDFPAHTPAPLLVLVPPVGRVDRNGLRPGSDEDPQRGMYAVLTKALLAAGVAVFRYDQPGAGRSSPGRFATDRSTALEGYTRAVDHARIDPDNVFLLGHGSGAQTIASIFPRFEAETPPAGVIFFDSSVGEHDAMRVRAPLLIVNPDRDPDNRYRYGEYVVETRQRAKDERLATKLRLIKDVRPGLLIEQSTGAGTQLAIHDQAVSALLDWVARYRD